MAKDILTKLEDESYISDLLYNEDSEMYSFKYCNGSLGGWNLKEFPMSDDELPMN